MGSRWKMLLAMVLVGIGSISAWAQPPMMFPPMTPDGPGSAFNVPGYGPQAGYPGPVVNYPPVPFGSPIPGADDPRKLLEKQKKPSNNPLEMTVEGPGAFDKKEPCAPDQGCYVALGGIGLWRSRLNSAGVVYLEPPSALPGISTYPTAPQPQVLNYHDVAQSFNIGILGTIGYRYDNQCVELTGYYIPGQNSSETVAMRDSLFLPFAQFPPPLGITGGGNNANVWLRVDRAQVLDNNSLANVEANYRLTTAPGVDVIIGLRYLRQSELLGILSDQDGLTVAPTDPRFVVTYQVKTQTNIIGPQLGFELETPVTAWLHVGASTKAVAGVNFYDVNVQVYRGDGFTALDNRRNNATISGAVEAGAFFDFLPFERMRIRAGYELLWLVNVPDAESEVSYNIVANPYGSRNDHGNIFFSGPFFEFSFLF